MKPVSKIIIYSENIKAGVLERIAQKNKIYFQFTYDTVFLESKKTEIHTTLPKKQKKFISEKLFPAFENLLFEGVNREIHCRRYKIDINDQMTMLATFGEDTIGSLTFKAATDQNEK